MQIFGDTAMVCLRRSNFAALLASKYKGKYLSEAEQWGALQWAQTITFRRASIHRRIPFEWITGVVEKVSLKLEDLKERMQRMHPEEDASFEWKADVLWECLDEVREEGRWRIILTKRVQDKGPREC